MEVTKEQMEKHIELQKKLMNNIQEFKNIKDQLWNLEYQGSDITYRNVPVSLLEYIYTKFPQDKVLNCYGDIFLIEEKHIGTYIGNRILWDLSLSKEKYVIEQFDYVDDDGEVIEPDYKVSVLLNGGDYNENT